MTLPDGGVRPGLEPCGWSLPPEQLSLPPHEVHVWLADLDAALREGGLASTLTEAERARARRFRAPQERARFTARRGILRAILSRYAHLPPRALEFAAGPYGKPFLVGRAAITFSASYSHALALYAVGAARPLGVDLERLRSDLPVAELGACAFTAAERAAFGAPPEDTRPATFFRAWTRKEALLKACGTGLLALPGCDVTPHGWSFYDLAPAPGYVATLATEGARAAVRGWCWPG